MSHCHKSQCGKSDDDAATLFRNPTKMPRQSEAALQLRRAVGVKSRAPISTAKLLKAAKLRSITGTRARRVLSLRGVKYAPLPKKK
jgi:hypothetical protein